MLKLEIEQENTNRLEALEGVCAKTCNKYNKLVRKHLSYFHQDLSNSSICGGFNPYYNREKFDEFFDPYESISKLDSSFRQKYDNNEKIRVCGRFWVRDEFQLRALKREVELLSLKYSVNADCRLEYLYPAKSGFIVGVGINSIKRYNSRCYDGLGLGDNIDLKIPNSRSCLEKIVSNKGKMYEICNPINPNLKIHTSTKSLNIEQQYQLAVLYMETFGPGWTIESVKSYDPSKRPIRIGVDIHSGEVMAAALADIDDQTGTIEFTEWVSKPVYADNSPKNAAHVGLHLIDYCRSELPEYQLYGEFRITNGSVYTAIAMGFGLPPDISGFHTQSIIKANVPVGGNLTDFAVLTYNKS